MSSSPTRPLSITILVCFIVFYAVVIIAWDMVAPFERDYTRGPATVVFGLRIFGLSAQVMHGVQLFIALALASGLWAMRIWGWHLVLLVAGYLVLSTTVWVAVYQDFGRIFFALLNLVLVNGLILMTFPHRNKFV
jgi:hypothetical protein